MSAPPQQRGEASRPSGSSAPRRPNNNNTHRGGPSHGPGPGSAPRNAHSSQSAAGEQRKIAKLDYDPAEYQLINHLPRRFPRGPGDVYITLKTKFAAQMQRCRKLLEAPGCREIVLFGMGAATNRAANLALLLKSDFFDLLELSSTTGSVEMTDELEPLRDDLDPISQSRFVSTIRIRVFFTKTLEDVKNGQKV